MRAGECKLSRAATAGLAESGGAAGVGLDFLYAVKAMFQAFEQFFVRGGSRGSEAIKNPGAVFAGCDEAGFSQIGKMTRDGGLGSLDNCHEVSDAKFAFAQYQKNPDADWIGQCFCQCNKIAHVQPRKGKAELLDAQAIFHGGARHSAVRIAFGVQGATDNVIALEFDKPYLLE